MTSLKITLEHFNAYLNGGSTNALALYMKYYDNRLFALNRDFHLITIDDDEIKLDIENLLRNLTIPERELGRYFQSGFSVYQLLQELTKEKYIQAHYMLQLVDKKTQLRAWDLILGGLLSATMIAGLLSTPIFSGVVAIIEGFLASARTLPIIGLIFNTSVAAYSLYKNHFDKKRPLFNRIRDNFFVVAGAILNFVGYGIWIITGSAMTPIIAGLFVAVSGLDVIKEVVGLVQEFIQHKKKNLLFDEEPLNINRTYARYDYSFKKYRNAIIINLIAATVLVGIMAAWCFMPGGIFVAIAATIAIVGVYAVKFLLLKKNDEIIREMLQAELRRIDREYQVSQRETIENSPELEDSHSNAPVEENAYYSRNGSSNSFFEPARSEKDEPIELNDENLVNSPDLGNPEASYN